MSLKVLDAELYEYMKNAIIDCLTYLEELYDSKEVIIQGDIEYVNFIDKLNSNFISFKELTTVKACCEYCLEKENYKPTILPSNKKINELDTHDLFLDVYHLVTDYIRTAKTTEFNEDIFKSVYVKREYFSIKHEIKFIAYCPLSGFTMDSDHLHINSRMCIRKITETELANYEKMFNFISTRFDQVDSIFINYVIEYRYTFKINKDDRRKWEQKIRNQVFRLITILRLFKEANIRHDHIRQYPTTHCSIYPPVLVFAPLQVFRGKYSLEGDEKTVLVNIYKDFLKIDLPANIRLAIDRFNISYERARISDGIIDLAIALESFYVERGDRKPRDRGLFIGNSASWFIGTNEDRDDIKESIVNGYSLRNDIVHGDDYDNEEAKKSKKELDSILRKSFRKYLFNS